MLPGKVVLMNNDLTKEHCIGTGGSLADSHRSCDNGGNGREDLLFLDTRLQVVADRTWLGDLRSCFAGHEPELFSDP